MVAIELFVSQLCPFAMRARLALAEKQVAVDEIEVDIRRKPDWFLAISPDGKVPLLRHEDRLVSESAIIAEYVEEAFPGRPLLPAQPHARARARAWVTFADSRLYARTHSLLVSSDTSLQKQLASDLAEELRLLERRAFAGRADDGPYLLGAEFSLADIASYPWFLQVPVLERFRGFRFPAQCNRLRTWQDAVANRDAVRAVSKPTQFYLDGYDQLMRAMAA